MKKIKIAQYGVCHPHAPGNMAALRRLSDDFEVVGYYNESAVAKTPHRFTGDLKPYEGLPSLTEEELLGYPGLEAVVVETPTNELVPSAIKCMERGLAIHTDKPGGEDYALYRRLLDGCRAKRLPCQIGFMFRDNPAFQFALRAIRGGLLGGVFSIEADMDHNYGGEAYQTDYIGKFPGGIMYILGCHLIDFTVAALGRPRTVTPFLKSAPGDPEGIRNFCMAVLEYPHALAVLRACSRSAEPTSGRSMRIAGTNGVLRFSPVERYDGKPVEVSLTLAKGAGEFPAGSHTLRFPPQTDRYIEQLRLFAKVLRGEAEDPYTYDHDDLVHQVILAASGLRPLE